MYILDTLIYDPARLACTEEEKDACLETVRKLARLAGQLRKNGVLYAATLAESEQDPFLRACLLEFEDASCREDGSERFARIARDYLAAESNRGGAFLRAVLVVKGLSRMLQVVHQQPIPSAWGNLLSFEIRGFFGAAYRNRVIEVVRQETEKPKPKRQNSYILEFDRFAKLPLPKRQTLLQDSDLRDVSLALKGAGVETERAILEAMTEESRAALQDHLTSLHNLRLIDITRPQEALLRHWRLAAPEEPLTQSIPEDELV